MQVGREQDPVQDAAMVVAVRHAVGPGIALRADANRKWSLNQAVAFGHAVAEADLQVLTAYAACTLPYTSAVACLFWDALHLLLCCQNTTSCNITT